MPQVGKSIRQYFRAVDSDEMVSRTIWVEALNPQKRRRGAALHGLGAARTVGGHKKRDAAKSRAPFFVSKCFEVYG
jgi:hypothetical protein